MYKKKRFSLPIKATALLLSTIILTETLAPSIAFAITSGPSQSEFNGFTSSDTSEMVDLATGDFKYDIPLITVPGSDGGYPLVLSYNAGVGMHDEASWVGLGWSLNPGVINRQMRGLPDDFNGEHGDNIKKTNYVRDNMNIGLSISSDLMAIIPEIYGFDMGMVAPNVSFPVSYTMYYNTYKGLGSRSGIGVGISALNNEMTATSAAASINLTTDSNEGSEVQGNLSAGSLFVETNMGFAYNARGGITSVSKGLTMNLPGIPRTLYKAGGNYSTASHVPEVDLGMKGGSAALTIDIEAGAIGTHLNIPVTIEGSFAYMAVTKPVKNFKPYGYLYTHQRKTSSSEDALMDYNRDNDVPINMKLPSLPVPVVTNDIYTIKGVGGGGVFRAFRNDAGIYYQPDVYNRNGGATVGLEVAASSGFKAAVDISGYYSSSYSGKWRSDYGNLDSKFPVLGNQTLATGEVSAMEPFYFKMLGERTPLQNKELYKSFDEVTPSHIGITYTDAAQEELNPDDMPEYEGKYPFSGMQKFKTGIANQMNGKPIPLFKRTGGREKRTTLIEYRTAKEVRTAGNEFFNSPNQAENPMPQNALTYSLKKFDFQAAHIQPNHISEFSVLQTDGSRTHYGIPIYNMSQKEVTFSSPDGGAGNDKTSGAIVSYDPSNFNPLNNNSRDKFLSINEISPYAHAYLLTNILSDDYVDLTNDGPTADDYGSYTKFNYNRHESQFKWRIPYTAETNMAINAKGFLSVGYDNKSTFTYGTKEIWYLHTIETKTHIAFFLLSDRKDGYQPAGENGNRTSNESDKKLQKLDKIILFSKKELAGNNPYPKALQTVAFQYSYDLCPNVPSNKGTPEGAGTHPTNGLDANAKKGKLTLKKVIITNEASTKGELSPYVFDYGTTEEENPSYAYGNTDRWGTYRPDNETVSGLEPLRNDYNPYTVQNPDHKAQLDVQAGAWNLKNIHTPSGSSINIQYECDDYAYVQDKHAQQMMQIVGTGNVDGSDDVFFSSQNNAPIRKNFRRLYFKPETPLTGSNGEITAAIAQYVNNLPDGKVYFKVNERLQIPKEAMVSPGFVSDYVTGYTKVESFGYIKPGNEVIPYIVIPEVSQKGKNPLRAAGLQYLRFKRANLSKTAPGGMQNVAEAVLGSIPMFFSNMEMIFGYYTWAMMKGHCEFISNDKPSFIRLNSPDGVKYGGGHRVKKITVRDGWNTLSGGSEALGSYEQNFVYKTPRRGAQISSGVAAYEPIFGGDENAMKYPHFYDPDNKFIHNDPAFFIEDPLPESYYPAPQVAYSRVLVYTSATESVKESGSGISVNEFYTALDYPTISHPSEPTKTDDNQTTFIPFIAGIQFRNLGYSQGFSVEINDMHGKPKAHYTYASENWDSQKKDVADQNRYLTYKKYFYNQINPQGLSSPNPQPWAEDYPMLASDVPATEAGAMGLEFELFSELRESSSFSFSGGAQINGGIDPVPFGIFVTGMPYFDYTETGSRTVTTNKIIYRTAVLTEVISYNEGNIERTRHIAFDKETGDPVLTITTSDFDDQTTDAYEKSTYSYDMPAHWYTKGMGGAYSNYRLEAKLNISVDNVTCNNAPTYFQPGDEIYCADCPNGYKRIWVNTVSSNSFQVVDKAGSPTAIIGNYQLTLLRSAKRNLQSATAGHIVSTMPPNGPGYNLLLQVYNQTAALPSVNWDNEPISVANCVNPETVYRGILSTSNDAISLKICGQITIKIGHTFTPANIRLYPGPTANTVSVVNIVTGITEICPIEIDGYSSCYLNCMDGVLNASAVEYQSTYDYDLADLAAPSLNDYISGKTGVYRPVRSNAYFANRKQQSAAATYPMYQTYAGEDGTFTQFVKFDFSQGNANNVQKPFGWRWASQVPARAYTRDGKLQQSMNPLGILTSNLYGYERNLVTATAVNASHREIAFESFEEHPLGTYAAANATGRLFMVPLTSGTITSEKSHTGKYAYKTGPTGTLFQGFSMSIPTVPSIDYTNTSKQIQLVAGQKYLLSAWIHPDSNNYSHSGAFIQIGSEVTTPDLSKQMLDGWRKHEAVFTAPASGNVAISIVGAPMYIDDIRIQPFNSEMKTTVYHPVKYIPVAELDGRNYATFFVYDEEGRLVITKKETETGIHTINHTRNNLKR
jgi:hypothetical protein